ncbi:hypothetical protein [Streptomyces sp. RFCAC02]|uniref:hypothetical protein n=1 Tax=Streptomyces sp. RFCAC02 TaxID=2499143 RepID=UPI0010202E53|nr:hypothetical protein [Streptomyces sp. RFCAC02]
MRLRSSAETGLPWRPWLLPIVGLAVALQVCLAAQPAQANDISDWTCTHLPFADKVCSAFESVGEAYDFATDPIGYLAELCREALASLFGYMIEVLLSTTHIDWGNTGFLRTYAMAFAVSSALTVILWLIAAAKRALQGVPMGTALTESIGFLLLSVMVSAFAPAAVAYATQMFDEAAEAMFAPVADDAADLTVAVTAALGVLLAIPGGQLIVVFLALAMLAAVACVWLELIVRDALILVGLVFGTTVFSGLVDRDLWGQARRWVGVMGAIIASKYVTLTTIALATGMLAGEGSEDASAALAFATLFTAIALLWLALYLPFQLAKFLPLLGDELQSVHHSRDGLKGRALSVGGQVSDTFNELRSRYGMGGGHGDRAASGAAPGVTPDNDAVVARDSAGRTMRGDATADTGDQAGLHEASDAGTEGGKHHDPGRPGPTPAGSASAMSASGTPGPGSYDGAAAVPDPTSGTGPSGGDAPIGCPPSEPLPPAEAPGAVPPQRSSPDDPPGRSE